LPDNDPAAAPSFDDSNWELLDLPHDYVVNGNYDPNTPGDQGPGSPKGGAGQSYLPREIGFYRKHFRLPQEWEGNTIWIHFDGVFRATKMWLNGEPVREHAGFPGDAHGEGGGAGMGGGYTSFSVRLDNTTSVQYGANSKNVLAVYVDPRMGSGWFYEGGGIYRKTHLHSAPPVHLETDGVYARSQVKPSDIATATTPALGASATSASVIATATVVNAGVGASETATVHFDLFDADGMPAGSAVSAPLTVKAASSKSAPSTASTAQVAISVTSAQLWSVARPYLYTLRTSVVAGGGASNTTIYDAINTTIGIYSTKWTGDQGFFMNSQHVKIRGFCNHESFGGVGMAIPDRVNLFRAQALRSVGGNGWR
jgi:beta-galactosidase/beta-glucuronidase